MGSVRAVGVECAPAVLLTIALYRASTVHLFGYVQRLSGPLNSCVNVERLAVLLELFQVERIATEAGHPHISRLVRDLLLGNSARALLDVSLVERLGLIELLSILRSVLIGVDIFLSGPAGAVPQRRVHRVARAVVEERLSRTIEVLLVLHMLVESPGDLSGEFAAGIAILEHRAGLLLGVDVARTESRLVGSVVRVVMGMSEGLGSRAISARRGIQGLVRSGDVGLVETGGGHRVIDVVESLPLEHISRLLGESLLQERVGRNLGSVALITGQHMILALN